MGNIIRSLMVFSEDFIPPTLPAREPELTAIRSFLEPLAEGQPTASNLFITGGIGVGKTVVSKHVCYSVPKNISSIYQSIKKPTTTNTLISAIMTAFFPDAKTRGIGSLELLNDFLKRIYHKSALIILDEIDNTPLPTIRPLLHTFSRESWITTFLISRKPTALDELPEDTRSSLKLRNLIFHTYTQENLISILEQRATLGLNPNRLQSETTEEISKHASYFGNARLAIDLLKIASERAEERNASSVTLDDAQDAIKISEEKAVETTLIDMPQPHQLLLKSIFDISKNEPPEFSKVLHHWQRALEYEGLPMFSKCKFYDVVKDLKKLDFVNAGKQGRGRGRGWINVLRISENIKDYFQHKE